MPFFCRVRLTPYPTYGATKPHSVVAPVSGSATGDFETIIPAVSAGLGQSLHSVPSTPFTSSWRFSPAGNDSFKAFHAGL
ncbi:hypothetical protein EGH57_05960 [Klebsiella aerogenes]|nr:hypothetical protein EGH57_05960 [Klebsiella aerogenes]